MHFRVKAWNTFEMSCSAFCIPKKTFSVIKKIGKFWFYEDCTELTRILMEFSSFGDHFLWVFHYRSSKWSDCLNFVTKQCYLWDHYETSTLKECCYTQPQEAVPDTQWAPIPSFGGLQAWGNMVPDKRQMSSKRESQTRQRSAPGDVSQGWEGGRQEEWNKESEVENWSHVKWWLDRRTGTETFCLHREDCLQIAHFQNELSPEDMSAMDGKAHCPTPCWSNQLPKQPLRSHSCCRLYY